MSLEFVSPNILTQDRLIRVVQGREKIIPRIRAITLLSKSNLPDRTNILSNLIKDESEDARVRNQAVVGLYATNSPQTSQLLLEDLQAVRDERTQATIVKFLGRVGGPNTLPAIIRVRDQATGFTQTQAELAAALIAYRYNLPEHNLAFPGTDELLTIPEGIRTRPTFVSAANEQESRLYLRSLSHETFGISLSRESLQQIKCEPRDLMLALNEEFSTGEATQKLQNQKALVGLIALKSPENGQYSTAYLILTTPKAEGSIQVLLKTTNGKTAFAGAATAESNQLKLSIQSVRQPGAVPIAFSAIYTNGSLNNVEAKSATRAIARRVPRSD